ncbi:hypothetical protein QKW35_06235 [Pontibacterium granulatum]|uniref:hypothetical protein n=1 Tax=Pontibacterium granulatum TaxID=2036029 RepID=UPI002499BF8B|nr:hypothetical protein [Pontibacterium granulatum]MDI3323968.1 hypothetical protein [Pontibacterium granulatum]
MRNSVLLALVLNAALSVPAFGHNVVGGVYAIGNTIEGEVGFSNGDMAKAGIVVQVRNATGNLIGESVIEDEGLFAFDATKRIDHYFYADLSAGHVLELVLPADELPATLPGGSAPITKSSVAASSASMKGVDQVALEQMIEKAVAKQVKPLRKELAAYKEKASLQDVLGGIGYIFGLVGLGIWLRQRKQEKNRASVS